MAAAGESLFWHNRPHGLPIAFEMTTSASLILEGVALPHELRELPAPPARMFVRGQIPRGPRIAVVGTREPSPDAETYARRLAFDLARAGVAVVSGGAFGIDAAAHTGALEAGGLGMIVAPSSLEHPYPAEHTQLFEAIVAAGGAHVSPFATGALPRRHQFFLRNACLVALSHALVMVEAPLRSGARNAGRWARRLNRPFFVVPAPPWNPRGLGCIAELELGARPLASVEVLLSLLRERQLHAVSLLHEQQQHAVSLLREQQQHAVSLLHERQLHAVSLPAPSAVSPSAEQAWTPPPPESRTRRERSRPASAARAARGGPRRGLAQATRGLQEAILELLEQGAFHADEVAAALSATAAEVSHAVLLLTLQGSLVQSPSGLLTRAR